ncbi:MAG: hypothetical protein RLZZ299_552 [Pseudomonadota bacterium]
MTPLLTGARGAHAHPVGLSRAELGHDALALTFARAELATAVPVEDLGRARLALDDLTFARVRVRVGDRPCVLGPGTWTALEADGLRGVATLECPPAPYDATWTYEAGFLAELPAGHRHVLQDLSRGRRGTSPSATPPPHGAETVLTAEKPAATLHGAAAPGTLAVLRDFGRLGVEHIAGGVDHLIFVLGLLLATTRLRDALLVVSGFTLAHSVTLSAAALGWIAPNPAWVEPAIAASVAFVGVENLGRPPVRRRVALTFAFGLVHGLGFAGALRGIGLPPGRAVPALAGFNLGVEAGQAVLVALAVPLLRQAARHPRWDDRAAPALSLGVALLGGAWCVERLATMR